MKPPDPHWSEPDAEAPLEDVEWRDALPHGEPFGTLLGEGGGAPEAEARRPGRDPIGSAELWRALEGYGPRPEHATRSMELGEAIIASWRPGEPMPVFAHRHAGSVVQFEPEEADASPSRTGRLVLHCPGCGQLVLILRGEQPHAGARRG